MAAAALLLCTGIVSYLSLRLLMARHHVEPKPRPRAVLIARAVVVGLGVVVIAAEGPSFVIALSGVGVAIFTGAAACGIARWKLGPGWWKPPESS
jgi:hypothetical protein